MATACIVIDSELFEFSRQVHRVPEQPTIKVVTPDRPNQAFDERMRNWSVRNRLDLLDLHSTQVGKPTVDSKQRVVWRQLLFPMATIKTAVHYTAAGSVAARVFDFAPAALAR